MIMTNDVVPTTSLPKLPTDKQILLAIKKRYDLNPSQEQLIFEIEGFGVVVNNENNYQEIATAIEGLKEKAGIDYTIENTYTDRLGRTQHHTLYGSRQCKIKITDRKLFEKALKNIQETATTPTQEDGEIIKYNGLTYNLKSCELRYKNGKSTTVSPQIREMKFFLFLYKHKGEALLFKDIAKEVETPEYVDNPELANKDYTEEVSIVKRDLRTLLLSVGMPVKEFNKMIVRVPKFGYKLV